MDSYLSQERSERSEITFMSDSNKTDDHIQRAARNLKDLQLENQKIRKEIQNIKNNPKNYVKPFRDELSSRINQLRDQNQSLRRIIERNKIPAYCQMTKKKIINGEDDERESMGQSSRNSFRLRRPLDEIDSNYDKNDAASTCLNYAANALPQNSNYVIGTNEGESRVTLANEIRLLLQKAEVFEEQLESINRKQKQALKKTSKNNVTEAELAKIYEYKKKLINILSKLKNRETSMNELVRTFRLMHEETVQKLKEATATLERLRQARISEDVDQKYAEVLELEERLAFINSQLEQMDQTKWLQEIAKELTSAVRRMGLQIPKTESVRDLIDELCQILIEYHLSMKKDGQAKLIMLKQYHEQEKKKNSKYILTLKAKEQALGKRLIDLQMQR